jgi:hypothetical protein
MTETTEDTLTNTKTEKPAPDAIRQALDFADRHAPELPDILTRAMLLNNTKAARISYEGQIARFSILHRAWTSAESDLAAARSRLAEMEAKAEAKDRELSLCEVALIAADTLADSHCHGPGGKCWECTAEDDCEVRTYRTARAKVTL